MSTPPELEKIDPADLERLQRLLKTLRMVDGWCKVNRAIGQFIIITIIGLLIVFSNALDAVKNLLGWKH